MINITLNINAAPELLAAISSFINAISISKADTNPNPKPNCELDKSNQNQGTDPVAYNQPMQQPFIYPGQNPAFQQVSTDQQQIQSQPSSNNMPMQNQLTAVPVNSVQASQQPTIQTVPTQGAAVPTTAQTYSMEQLAVAATQIVDAGRRAELVGLLGSFGVQALTALPKDQYGTFATQLRALGAKI